MMLFIGVNLNYKLMLLVCLWQHMLFLNLQKIKTKKLDVNKDAVFRRILGISRDIGLVEKSLNDLQEEFAQVQMVKY
jgi:hypothetical protein